MSVKGPLSNPTATRLVKRTARAQSRREEEQKKKGPKSERLRALLPDLWALVRPRRGTLLLGLGLMAVNRVAGLVLPASTKFLVDDVIGRRELSWLTPLVGAVVLATLVQGVTSFALTQLLSKAAQRLIAEMRRKVQAHIGRLPVAYYDANKTGQLVSRIMSDVEGVRNLIGTGLVEFLGGLLTAGLALAVMLSFSPGMTAVTFLSLARLRRRALLGLRDHAADLPRARQDLRRGHGPADRVAGRRAGGEGLPRRGPRGRGLRARAWAGCSTTC